MNVLLISTNIETGFPYPVPPLGLAYVSRYLKDAGHAVQIVDCCFQNDWLGEIRRVLSAFSADVVGLSMRNIDNCLFPNTVEYLSHNKRIVGLLRGLTAAPIVVGGAAARIAADSLRSELDADWAYTGRASEAMVQGFETIAAHERPSQCGDFVGTAGRISEAPETSATESGRPSASVYDEIDVPSYVDNGGCVGFQTKYGCNEQCIYCTYPLIEGTRIVCTDPEVIVETVAQTVRQYGLSFYEFADSTFNNPLDHAKDICARLVEKRLDAGWTAFASPKFCDREFLDLCRRAGCTGLDLGVDSGSERVLETLKKGFAPSDVERACVLARQVGIPVCCNLALGAPGESHTTIEETFLLMEKSRPAAVSVYSALRVYPGTELERLVKQEGVVVQNALFPVFYVSPEAADVNAMLVAYRAGHPEWMLRGISKKPSQRCIARFWKGRTSPLWADKGRKGSVLGWTDGKDTPDRAERA